MKNFKSHFKFNKQERSGIFFLLLLIVLFQLGYFLYQTYAEDKDAAIQLNAATQAEIDAFKRSSDAKDSVTIKPFNPNFITDYKGYSLGMSTEAIDRLHAFREAGNFANSAAAFQKVTQISDTLLNRISPYFKFPEWSKNQNVRNPVISKDNRQKPRGNSAFKGESTVRSDLNTATATDLQKISGIGEKLAARIINFREQLNGFLVEEQLYDVYGLEPVVVKKTLAKFTVINAPDIEKINVTWASYNELRNLLYINDKFAKSILEYRNKNTFNSLSALKHLDGFPEGRFESLKLYLTF